MGNARDTLRFYRVLGKLAHKKELLATLGDEGGHGLIIHSLRLELAALSPRIK
jgi:hypothetical protein